MLLLHLADHFVHLIMDSSYYALSDKSLLSRGNHPFAKTGNPLAGQTLSGLSTYSRRAIKGFWGGWCEYFSPVPNSWNGASKLSSR